MTEANTNIPATDSPWAKLLAAAEAAYDELCNLTEEDGNEVRRVRSALNSAIAAARTAAPPTSRITFEKYWNTLCDEHDELCGELEQLVICARGESVRTRVHDLIDELATKHVINAEEPDHDETKAKAEPAKWMREATEDQYDTLIHAPNRQLWVERHARVIAAHAPDPTALLRACEAVCEDERENTDEGGWDQFGNATVSGEAIELLRTALAAFREKWGGE